MPKTRMSDPTIVHAGEGFQAPRFAEPQELVRVEVTNPGMFQTIMGQKTTRTVVTNCYGTLANVVDHFQTHYTNLRIIEVD